MSHSENGKFYNLKLIFGPVDTLHYNVTAVIKKKESKEVSDFLGWSQACEYMGGMLKRKPE